MEQQAQINTFIGGMNIDQDVSLLAENSYRYAENIRLQTDKGNTGGALQNIEYIRKYETGIPKDETIIGTSSSRWYRDGEVEECGIVITKKGSSNKVLNTIYVVSGFDSIKPVNTVIVKGYLGLTDNVSIVSNYESTDVSNIYVTDGNSPIKAINIQKQITETINDPTYFDSIPGAVLAPLQLQELVSGTLPACTIQYCYQLFSTHGSETTTSALSKKIPITVTATTSKGTSGSMKDSTTDKGCRLKATTFNDGRFNRLRIISIQYRNSTDLPKIQIVSETDFIGNTSGVTTFEYIDTGSGYLKEITLEEFNDLVPFEFKSNIIEKKDNRLFAANVQEITWDVDFDARAYRATFGGNVVLKGSFNNDITATQADIINGVVTIPEEHDCINPMNESILYPESRSEEDFSWDVSNSDRHLGGAGINIRYRFVTIEMTESEQAYNGTFKYNMELSASKKSKGYISILDFDTQTKELKRIENPDGFSRINNYADPYFVSNFLGYQRDETYRFGIIFYNNKNIPTPVHWIGDIRFPSADYVDYNINSFVHYPFRNKPTSELVSNPIGIMFEVRNLPKDAVAYEIVRCKRTLSDRTVITQGVLSKTINFKGWRGEGAYDPTVSLGEIDRRPYIVPTFSQLPISAEIDNGSMQRTIITPQDPVDQAGVFDFTSADVCFDKKHNIVENGMYIVPLYYAHAEYGKIPTSTRYTNAVLENTSAVGVSAFKGIPNMHGSVFGRVYRMTADNKYALLEGYHKEQPNLPIGAGVVKLFEFENPSITTDNGSAQRSARIIEDAKIATNIPPAIATGISDVKHNYIDYVGNYAFTNWSIGTGHGPHGITTAIFCPEMYDKSKHGFAYPGLPNQDMRSCAGGLIVNIKKRATQYGGNTYSGRQKSVYISAGCYVKNDFENYKDAVCFGGDTYLGVLDYTHTSLYNVNSFDAAIFDKRYVEVYIPLESSVNVYYRADKHFVQDTNPSGEEGYGGTANVLYMTEPGQLATSYIQTMPMYTYNSAYSSTDSSKKYISKSMYAKNDSISINRITCSDLKTNNELNDSWTKFRFANYLDVDSKYGKLTNLKNFNNRLYFFQDEAVGVASVNERSLITDNNASQLVLGTGTVLSRYDYIVVGNGSSVTNDKSIVNSGTTLYWFDFDKNTICSLNNNFIELSKSKSVQNYLNNLPKASKTNAVSFYDKKYNEVWFRLYDKALIFNEQLNVFTSFYTHNPNWFFPFSDKLITIKDNNMYYLHNIYEVNSEQKEERVAKICFVVNKDVSNSKVFDNVSFDAKFIDGKNANPHVISDITFATKTQKTNPISFQNIDYREDNYRFYIPRESQPDPATQQLTNKSYAGRMRGKYLMCDYTFDCNDGREMKIPYIKTTYRYSMI